jgi:hypothetical protein
MAAIASARNCFLGRLVLSLPIDQVGVLDMLVETKAVCPGNQPAPLRVVQLHRDDEDRWQRFVSAHPEGLIYHHPAWLHALTREYQNQSVVLACEDQNGSLHGVLPLMMTSGLPFRIGGPSLGRRLASLPRTPIAGPLAVSHAARSLLLDEAGALARSEGLQLQIRSLDPGLAVEAEEYSPVPWKNIYSLELPACGGELRFGNAATRHRIHWAVKKAQSQGVSIRPAERQHELHAWYRLYLETMRWYASPPRSYQFFLALWDSLHSRGLLELLLAEHDRIIIAGYLLLKCGNTVHCYLNGRVRAQLGFHPNDYLQWRAIHDACAAGYRCYDFGEVDEGQQGLIDFKTKWGARPSPSFRYYWPPLRDPCNSAFQRSLHLAPVAGRMWRKLPLSLTARIGERIYSYL